MELSKIEEALDTIINCKDLILSLKKENASLKEENERLKNQGKNKPEKDSRCIVSLSRAKLYFNTWDLSIIGDNNRWPYTSDKNNAGIFNNIYEAAEAIKARVRTGEHYTNFSILPYKDELICIIKCNELCLIRSKGIVPPFDNNCQLLAVLWSDGYAPAKMRYKDAVDFLNERFRQGLADNNATYSIILCENNKVLYERKGDSIKEY